MYNQGVSMQTKQEDKSRSNERNLLVRGNPGIVPERASKTGWNVRPSSGLYCS